MHEFGGPPVANDFNDSTSNLLIDKESLIPHEEKEESRFINFENSSHLSAKKSPIEQQTK
jgi:hypothetical protein